MADDVWLIDSGPSEEMRLPLPTRAVLVRLGNGATWLYAPARFTDALRDEIDAIGPLRHIVAPTATHLEPLPDWLHAYPEAQFWATEPGAKRAGSLSSARYLKADRAEAAWEDDLRQLVVQGNPSHPEAVFFHRASDTLILADLISAVETAHLSPWLRPVVWLMGLDDAVGRMPRRVRRGVRDEQAFADSLERIINWGPRRILLRHGRWYRRDGVGELERAFRKILRERQWDKALQKMQDDAR
ncbi:MAG: DUF4336 domain-containing protein [Pseudomonadota bacterium]